MLGVGLSSKSPGRNSKGRTRCFNVTTRGRRAAIHIIVCFQPFHPSDVIGRPFDRHFVLARVRVRVSSMVAKRHNNVRHPRRVTDTPFSIIACTSRGVRKKTHGTHFSNFVLVVFFFFSFLNAPGGWEKKKKKLDPFRTGNPFWRTYLLLRKYREGSWGSKHFTYFHIYMSCFNATRSSSQPSASRRIVQFPWYLQPELSLPAVTIIVYTDA